jgi:hypothetical protein
MLIQKAGEHYYNDLGFSDGSILIESMLQLDTQLPFEVSCPIFDPASTSGHSIFFKD